MVEDAGPDPLDRPGAVRAGEELDDTALAAYLAGTLPDLPDDPDDLDLEVRQFRRGHSNLTYLLRVDGREIVLRRPPFGSEVATAHDVLREHRVLSALADDWPKAPRPLFACSDEAVLGAPFYGMERLEGIIVRSTDPPGLELDEETMAGVAGALVETLAELHALDPEAIGLGEMGRPEGYVRRQVEGWSTRYRRAATEEVPGVERAMDWLGENLPPERDAALVHNDYKYDNLVLDPADPTRVVGVLDWEMATVGDPLMDLGTTLGYWVEADDPDEMHHLPVGPTALPGNPTRLELVEAYESATARPVENPLFYYVYGLLKVAGIAQQIYRRYVDGKTGDPRFEAMIGFVRVIGRAADRALERGSP